MTFCFLAVREECGSLLENNVFCLVSHRLTCWKFNLIILAFKHIWKLTGYLNFLLKRYKKSNNLKINLNVDGTHPTTHARTHAHTGMLRQRQPRRGMVSAQLSLFVYKLYIFVQSNRISWFAVEVALQERKLPKHHYIWASFERTGLLSPACCQLRSCIRRVGTHERPRGAKSLLHFCFTTLVLMQRVS